MSFLSKILGTGGDSWNVRCAECGTKMTIISNAFARREVMARSQGCFQCAACGKYTCYGCSDNREPCRCGAQQWQQRTYVT